MIDLHCHILPGVDDGPRDHDGFLNMAKTAVQDGITHLFATPHHLNGRYENTKSEILECVPKMNKILEIENIPLTLHPGQEVRIHRELFNSLKTDEILTLDNKGKFILLEFPLGEVPTFSRETVYELLLKDITPIIVHPERNLGLLEENNQLFDLVKEGALVQLTCGSILGKFGKRVKNFSQKIIEHNLAHFIATDAHNVSTRGFTLQQAYETISKTFGISQTFYFKENAEIMLSGKHLYIEEPVRIKKKILGIF